MVKYFFIYNSKNEAEGIAKALSLMFLMPLSKIRAEDVWDSHIRTSRKIETFTVKELLTRTICKIKSVPSLTIVELDEPLDTDKELISTFKDSYLGTVRKKIEKARLIELARLQSNLHNCEFLEESINPRFSVLKRDFEESGFDEKECKEIEKLLKVGMKPVNDWSINKNTTYKENIKPLTKFISRDY